MFAGVFLPLLYAPLSQQTLSFNGDSVRISRDAYGIPTVEARTLPGLFYGAGYAVAQDRLWQMERNRRVAKGEMAEIYGPDALAQDRAARIDGYTLQERRAQFARLSPELQSALQGYAEGVNAWIEESRKSGKLPTEFDRFGLDPAPWTVTDSIAIAQHMSRRFGAFGEGEFRNLLAYTYLKARLGDNAVDAVNDIAWNNDPDAPVSVPPEEDSKATKKPGTNPPRQLTLAHLAKLPKLTLADLLENIRAFARTDEREFAEAHGLYTHFGSYAVVVDSERSSTGNALMLGAPQMGWSTPQIAHEIRLRGAGLEVVGMGFPGIPGVLIGHTPFVAWTTTSGLGDTEDVFVERIDPENPANYLHNGKSFPFEVRTEEILVKGSNAVRLEIRRSIHGPVVRTSGREWAYVRRASYWNREIENFDAFFAMYRAKNLDEFEEACSKIVTSHNFLAVDSEGNIGYWYTGLYPRRSPELDPRFPTPGTGEYEWRGFLPFQELPKCRNPRRGWLANWNNKPANWWDNSDTPVWGTVHRYKRLNDLLGTRSLVSPDYLKEIVRDIATYQLDADFFLEPLLELLPEEDQGAKLLRAWDRHERAGAAPATIFRTYFDYLREETLLPALGNFGSDQSFRQIGQASLLWRILRPDANTGFDYLRGKKPRDVMRTAWVKTVENLRSRHGPDLAAVPFRPSEMNLAPLRPVPYANRGTYILIVDMARSKPRSVSVLCPGQSENPESPHYADQRDLASWWMYKPLWPTPQTENR